MEDCSFITETLIDRTEDKVKTNLDKFLDDTYEKEIVFKTNHEEECFIADGVKALVTKLILLALSLGEKAVEKETCRFKEAFPSLSVVKGDNSAENKLIEVGSFYEGTLNGYPNEFDFIFLLGTFKNNLPTRSVVRFNDQRYTYKFRFDKIDRDNHVHRIMAVVSALLQNSTVTMPCDNELAQNPAADRLERKIVFDKHVIVRESSAKLLFIYQNEYGEQKDLHVRITPAFKVLEPQSCRATDTICSSKFAKEEVSKTGSVLVVDGMVWFAQTEVNFINNVISRKHKKVYRLVKYLVGDKADTEALESRFVETGLWRYNMGLMTSYMIKVGIILHHYDCKRLENETESACVLDMLNFLKNIKSDAYFKTLTGIMYKPNFFRSADRYAKLRDMIEQFELMKVSAEDYAYDKYCVCPINKALLKHFNTWNEERSNESERIVAEFEDTDDETDRDSDLLKYCPAILKFTLGLAVLAAAVVLIVVFST